VVYNYGIPGAHIVVLLSKIEQLDLSSVNNMIIGLSFSDFLEKEQSQNDFVPNIQREIDRSGYVNLKALLSIDALWDSIKTIFSQNSNAMSLDESGFNPFQETQSEIQKYGQYRIVKQKIQSIENKYSRSSYKSHFIESDDNYHLLKERLSNVLDSRINLYLFIYPYHQKILSIYESHGLYEEYMQFKNQVNVMVKELIEQKKDTSVKIQLWDFAEINEYTSEPLPIKETDPPMKWNWEIVHFNDKLGDKMIEAIFSKDQKSPIGRRID
jgi:hypothetical protein